MHACAVLRKKANNHSLLWKYWKWLSLVAYLTQNYMWAHHIFWWKVLPQCMQKETATSSERVFALVCMLKTMHACAMLRNKHWLESKFSMPQVTLGCLYKVACMCLNLCTCHVCSIEKHQKEKMSLGEPFSISVLVPISSMHACAVPRKIWVSSVTSNLNHNKILCHCSSIFADIAH